ncbi:hypothetical protein ABPG72_020458 [Tetrahymena utriculariae]
MYNLEKGLILDVKTLQNHFQFNKTQDQTIPIMVSVKTLGQTNNMEAELNPLQGRPNLDLICVIDNSGSMSGCKIENVQNTILQLIEMLNENDRLSLITFNSYAAKLCGLRKVDNQNKENLQAITKQMCARDGTDITNGLKIAFQILQNRKQKNQVSSIFLLSDGQDDGSDIKIRNLLQTTYSQLQEESFTIHQFGFGSDHDGPLIDQVDEFFIDALGGLFSVVAQDLTIKIEINRQNELFQKFFKSSYISKTYGYMWDIINKNQELTIRINQIFQGVSKDFIFELTIPKSEIKELQDFERNLDIIKVQLTASPVSSEKTTQIVKQSNLVLTLFTENEKVAQDSEINDNVEFNYIRVKAAQAIKQAIKYADINQYSKGQNLLIDMLKNIENSHPINQAKLQVLREDLIQCQQNVYNQIGDAGASGLGSALAKCTNLSNLTLSLGSNKIGDAGASGLGSALAKCTNLSNLTLSLVYNQIGDAGASGLGSALAKCTNLSNLTLHLYSNNIGDAGASGLGSALAQCTNLSNLALRLYSNNIGDAGASGLGSALAKCTNLSNLTLSLGQKQFVCCFGL